jgi:hypothetical protein
MNIDIFMHIDMKESRMLRPFKRTKEMAVDFCDRCARVCDAGCRRAALREQTLLQASRYGVRI